MNTNMKKYIYSLAMLVLGLVSCNSWDDAVTENYGDGPAIDVKVTEFTDSAFTFTLTPAAGTQFYNFIIDQNDESEVDALDAAALLKGSYGNAANLKQVTAEAPTFTAKIKAEPNTTYQIYAVAASDKGIVGKVAVASVTTTDEKAPALVSGAFKPDPATKSVAITFDQNLKRGTGAITGIYYKEWDWENPVTIDPDSIKADIKGNVVTLSAPTTPDGAIVAFSWAGGAFVDAKGNNCGAFTTTYDENKDKWTGAVVENKKVAFEVTDKNVTAPKDGSKFSDWKTFQGEFTFDFDIYRIDEDVKNGDITVTYTGDMSASTYKLKANQWYVEGKKLIFTLPAQPAADDVVTVQLKEGIFFDVYGNPNTAFASKTSWIQDFVVTTDLITGTFNLGITYDGEAASLGNFSIELAPTEEKPNGLLFKNFYSEVVKGAELDGYYDLEKGKVYIEDGQLVGFYTNKKGVTYGLVFYNYDNKTDDEVPVPFTVKADGSMVADAQWGIYAFSEDFSSALGWFEIANTTKLTPVAASARKAVANKKMLDKKVIVPASLNTKKFIRK